MKMDSNTLHLNKLLSLNNYMNFNLWFINLCNLFVGLYFIVANYYKRDHYPGCLDVFTLMCINVGISAIPVLSCSSIYEINFLYFGGTIYLIYRNILTINDCYSVYDNTYYFNYFIASASLLIFNEVIYLIKFGLVFRIFYYQNKIIKQNQNQNRNLYLNPNDYESKLIQNNLKYNNRINTNTQSIENNYDTNQINNVTEIDESNNIYEE